MDYEKTKFERTLCSAVNNDCVKHCNLKGVCTQCENVATALLEAGARFPLCKTGDTVYEIYSDFVPNKELAFGWGIITRSRPVVVTKICIEGDNIHYYKEEYKNKIEEIQVFVLTSEEAENVCRKVNEKEG